MKTIRLRLHSDGGRTATVDVSVLAIDNLCDSNIVYSISAVSLRTNIVVKKAAAFSEKKRKTQKWSMFTWNDVSTGPELRLLGRWSLTVVQQKAFYVGYDPWFPQIAIISILWVRYFNVSYH